MINSLIFLHYRHHFHYLLTLFMGNINFFDEFFWNFLYFLSIFFSLHQRINLIYSVWPLYFLVYYFIFLLTLTLFIFYDFFSFSWAKNLNYFQIIYPYYLKQLHRYAFPFLPIFSMKNIHIHSYFSQNDEDQLKIKLCSKMELDLT